MMINRKTYAGLEIYLFTHIFVDRIYNMIKDFNTHKCVLDFDICLLGILAK